MPVETATEQPFGNLGSHLNKVIDQMNRGYFGFFSADAWAPNVNLYEDDDAYRVCVDLAGVEKDKIDISVQDQRLLIKGHRQVPCHPDGDCEPSGKQRVRVHLMEIDQGHFSREVELPNDANHGTITAAYRNGFLWIELPKK
jgi:HSP20 family protein